MFLNLWRRYFPEKPRVSSRKTDLSGDIAAFEAMQRDYVNKLCAAESLARLENRKAGLTQVLKYDESTDTLAGL